MNSTTLLGVKIQDDLRWESNTNAIIKKAYSSMRIITNLIKFNVSTRDLIIIYIIYVRSVLEYCCTVWHNSLTIEQSTDIERVQKVAIRTILNNFEIEYEDALEKVQLEKLELRREQICLKFAQKCTKSTKNEHMFPKDIYNGAELRTKEPYEVPFALKERFKKSAIPYMARLLNSKSTM